MEKKKLGFILGHGSGLWSGLGLPGLFMMVFISGSSLAWSAETNSSEVAPDQVNEQETLQESGRDPAAQGKAPRVIYQKKTEMDLDATEIQGELKTSGDFYFQHKPEEKMDSLVKRRKNFHREMLRDVVFSK